ncbi:hypothetical protein EF847_19220 [Actinobacteria bacterium YIM 96077]|uniref:Uncharacterized protein n=1 Tax=Phytoactinopolyspora halophila TaxID=1981511 RepID=A0A329QP18_9ACTN|nr:hypothetical protein [Phytoactinopolyspora halophila]AYY14506.1 hypothetical protein EF847_19220 [Actinobacteria bacterium YIM 96077]RAW14114.1 hypothetical protein DPM12_11910 [Phytoactinopolyspora halophila]
MNSNTTFDAASSSRNAVEHGSERDSSSGATSGSGLDSTLESKAVRAFAGAADVAVTSLRDLSTRVVETVSDDEFRRDVRERVSDLSKRATSVVTDENVRGDLRRRLDDLPQEAKALRDDIPERMKEVPVRTAQLQEKAREAFSWERRHGLMTEIPAKVRDAASQAAQQASKTIDDLAGRGEGVVTRWRDEYRVSLGEKVVAIRGRVAEAADDVADAADKVADDLGESGDTGEPGEHDDQPR